MKEFLKNLLRNRYVSTTLFSALFSGSYISYKERVRYEKIMKAFIHGAILTPLADVEHRRQYIRRPEIEGEIKKILRPQSTGRYYVIRGEVGCGKTRTLVEIVQDMIEKSKEGEPGAPIYILASAGHTFVDSLAKAINYQFDEHLSFKYMTESVLGMRSLPSKRAQDRLSRTLAIMEDVAIRYKQRTGKGIVLVIDGIERLQEHAPGALEHLQEKAKLWADANIVTIVFVSSDEATEVKMQENHSDWSRAAAPVYFRDLTRNEAENALTMKDASSTSQSKFTQDEIEYILDTVGHRVLHLLELRQDREEDVPLEVSVQKLKAKERTKLRFVQMTPAVLRILKILCEAGEDGVHLNIFETSETDNNIIKSLATANIVHVATKIEAMIARLESKLTESVVKQLLKDQGIIK